MNEGSIFFLFQETFQNMSKKKNGHKKPRLLRTTIRCTFILKVKVHGSSMVKNVLSTIKVFFPFFFFFFNFTTNSLTPVRDKVFIF